MRAHPCARLFCLSDTLTNASLLPGDGAHYPSRGLLARCEKTHLALGYVTYAPHKSLKSRTYFS